MYDIFYIDNPPKGLLGKIAKRVKTIDGARSNLRTRYGWIVDGLNDYTAFDWQWEPPPWEAGQDHVWPSQFQQDGGTTLITKQFTGDTNYLHHEVLRNRSASIIIVEYSSMDATAALESLSERYSVSKTPLESSWEDTIQHIRATAKEPCWVIKSTNDHHKFDFCWHPDPLDPPLMHVFGTQHQKTGGPVYIVPGAGEHDVKYVAEPRVVRKEVDDNWQNKRSFIGQFDFTWHPDDTEPPMNYQFGTQWQKTGGPLYLMEGATGTKYVRHPRISKSTIDDYWVIPDGVDIEGFDFTWHPDATDPPMNYQFGTQWQKTGGPLYEMPGATDVKYVTQQHIKNVTIAKDVYVIDFGNSEMTEVVEQLKRAHLTVKKRGRFIDSYKGTLERLLREETEEFVWVCSSVCDYEKFDFSWHPEQWQATMLHVFASNDEKFGDTFLVHVPTFQERIKEVKLLEWYNTLNFVDISVPRWRMPYVFVTDNSLVDAVKSHVFKEPLALFTNSKFALETVTVPLWREKTRTIVSLSTGNNSVIVPRDAKNHVTDELYAYPYINKLYAKTYMDMPLDVVFLHNGETNAQANLEHLKSCLKGTNRFHEVSGVNGRVAAYQACAEVSTTSWLFIVWGKLEVNPNFDWLWQPDRLQKNKHYIFYARNPVNDLVYGHMGMAAYHRGLTLENDGSGLDFIMSQPHEVVPIESGTARYDADPWMTWRTAFREVLKLIQYVDQGDVAAKSRLRSWLNVGNGPYGEWSIHGAKDAQTYYEQCRGEYKQLKLSYEWDWLRQHFDSLYQR